ncbi:hypothetical protein OH77DRAFT_1587802, partial [Trametes cingulata]
PGVLTKYARPHIPSEQGRLTKFTVTSHSQEQQYGEQQQQGARDPGYHLPRAPAATGGELGELPAGGGDRVSAARDREPPGHERVDAAAGGGGGAGAVDAGGRGVQGDHRVQRGELCGTGDQHEGAVRGGDLAEPEDADGARYGRAVVLDVGW